MTELQLVSVAQLIDRTHEEKARGEKPRSYIGASVMGHKCDRWIWLSFRWAVFEQFEGRMLRLFRRGHNEEKTVIEDLEAIGLTVTRQQEEIDFGCHVRGHIDGVVSGLKESSKPHILEIKTHNLKSFNELEKKGVKESKPVHYAQMQAYMRGLGIERTLYVAVCKDDDRIYVERVRYDKGFSESNAREFKEGSIERAQRIALEERAPVRISENPTWYECKMCAGHDICHESKLTKNVNCRTCAHSTARADSTWYCERWESEIPYDGQLAGCPSHVLHPDLVPWKMESIGEPWHVAYDDTVNGNPDEIAGAVSSEEIVRRNNGS
jgi:hypothetical protein